MRLLHFLMALTLLGVVAGWSQTAVLRGTVTNAVKSVPITGADVIVIGPDGKEAKKTISGKDGRYSIDGLKKGDKIAVNYRKVGYAPDPHHYDVSLDHDDNSQDATLYENVADSSYWFQWSNDQKLAIDATAATPDERAKMFEVQWTNLGTIGLSVEARAQAARQLVYVAPQATHSPVLASFANADIDKIQTYRLATRFAIEGTGKLPKEALIPPNLAEEVTANEIKKQAPANKDEFLLQYYGVWGDESTKHVRLLLDKDNSKTKK